MNAYIGHLSVIPESRVAAIRSGDLEWMGWDINTIIAARQHNLILSLIGGLSKGLDITEMFINAPGEDAVEDEPIRVPTIAEFNAGLYAERFRDGG